MDFFLNGYATLCVERVELEVGKKFQGVCVCMCWRARVRVCMF